MRVSGPRRVTAALFAACLAALVSAAPHDAYEDRHQPLTALDPSTFVDGTSRATRFSGDLISTEGDDASSADDRAAPFAVSVRASRPRASGELECEDTVVVTVTARVAPSDKHWVASYSPPNANVTATAPTKYALLTRDPAYLETGVANLSFKLTCARHAYDFVVFTDDWVVRQGWRQDLVPSAVAVARSDVVTLKDADGPRAPRLVALASTFDAPTESTERGKKEKKSSRAAASNGNASLSPLAVAWSSGRGAEKGARLRWWVEEKKHEVDEVVSFETSVETEDVEDVKDEDVTDKNVYVSYATTRTYSSSDLCGAPANGTGFRDPGYVHVARFGAAFSDVKPGTRVVYELTDDTGATYPSVDAPRLAFRAPRLHVALGDETKTQTREDSFEEALVDDSSNDIAAKNTNQNENASTTMYPFALALFGDMGRGTEDDATTWQEYGSAAIDVSNALTKFVDSESIDAAFLFGDLSYAVGYGSVWDEFCEQITPWASRVPLLTSAGNHELDGTAAQWQWALSQEKEKQTQKRTRDVYGGGDSGGECGVPSSVRFPNPGSLKSTGLGMGGAGGWFVVTLGPFRVVSMNTEADFSFGSAQFRFLEAELSPKRVDRDLTPFVVVVAHRPALVDSSFGRDKPSIIHGDGDANDGSDVGVALALQEHVWPLFVESGVDAFVAGHNHAYQRHCAFLGFQTPNRSTYFDKSGCALFSTQNVYENPRAPVSLVVGTGGAGFTRHDLGASFVETTQYAFGFLSLVAESSTTMRGRFFGVAGEALDEFVIVVDDRDRDRDRDLGSSAVTPPRGPRRAGGGVATA